MKIPNYGNINNSHSHVRSVGIQWMKQMVLSVKVRIRLYINI